MVVGESNSMDVSCMRRSVSKYAEDVYSALANEVCSGRGKVPVADYKVVQYVNDKDKNSPLKSESTNRSCYSFCMCPGGQVVLTSTSPSEICINGMSFSRRASRWANAALVVTVSTKDFNALNFHGPLAGVEFQREFERRAAIMGGGNFVVPVQTVSDFLDNKVSVTSMPSSSYRLGVKAASLHELFPIYMTDALRYSIAMFDKELPGFISKEALLHGVETRTSSPIQIPRDTDTYESMSLRGLYPVGEGAGYAGGIVSAAVDGMYSGFSVAQKLGLFHGDIESVLGKAQSAGMMSTCSIIIVKLYKIEEDDEGTSNATPVSFHKIKVRKVLDERVRFSIQIHSNVRKVSFELQSDIAVPFHLVDLEPVQGIFFSFFPSLNRISTTAMEEQKEV
ncbi:hypothetical protein GOBAR_AA06185 [Gossypium barbadense]|uniref:FAD-dependent protein C-terminal domain-containing protein n=1 Tax=Gossypium barbadense TaxID=3634 RepID=A0A2P5YFM3_GOSBA|nr:hypothetical protein GOBAR_AA06185 [Gossypium barbadense]